MSKIEEIINFIENKALDFGAIKGNSGLNSYLLRNNTGNEALQEGGAYFGFIHPEEEPKGPFHDFSLTIFPCSDENPWLVCLGIGSLGFKNDFELAAKPGIRRLFTKLVNENGYVKTNFLDIESNLPISFLKREELKHIRNSVDKYKKVLPACQIVQDPTSEEGKRVITAFVAGYAKIREWASNKDHRTAIASALREYLATDSTDEVNQLTELLKERKFVIIQGAPGTGKTRAAKRIVENLSAETHFIQFHAETSYSDFVYGIKPNILKTELSYISSEGILAKAINAANADTTKNVCLIIDEINRANLSNVLGPIFYLFEHKMESSSINIEITPSLVVTNLPSNFFVIATMNTADRSLAVVDFALRRRFAWYTLRPKVIDDIGKNFFKEDFIRFQEIFYWHASSNEISLQPGQGYFIAGNDGEMKNRIRYELYPLVKEYLTEGLLQSATEEFNDYFTKRINLSLYE